MRKFGVWFAAGITMALAVVGLPKPSMAAEGTAPALRDLLSARMRALDTDPAAAAVLEKQGREAASFCALCHGADGNSVNPLVPNLAGQNPAYLLDQIEKFADGRRKDYIMTPLALRFSAEEKVVLAMYYSTMAPTPKIADPGLARQGEMRYRQTCVSCHGPDARGGEKYARLAGQRPEYLRHRLFTFQQQTGTSLTVMTGIAKTLSDEDVEGLVAFLSSRR
jgi:cytochrome c553